MNQQLIDAYESDRQTNNPILDRYFSCRNILTVLAFLGFINVYALRVNLSVALVAMVNSSHAVNVSMECVDNSSLPTNSSSSHQGEFDWDSQLQGIILSAFFYGYIFTQIPGGWLAERVGGKWLYGGGVLWTAVLTLFTPVAARLHPYCLIAVRVLEGIGEGVTFPAMHALLGFWAPPLERSRMAGFIYAGTHFGTVIALPLSGVLCDSGFLGGWPSAFYVFGVAGCLWFILWVFFVFDSPAKHPRISAAERHYIEQAIGTKSAIEQKPATPWLAIFTSPPFYAILVAHVCTNWGLYTLLTTLPTYMKHILNLDLSKNGFFSGLSYLMCAICMIVSGLVADQLRKGCCTTTVVRKMFYCPGSLLAAIFLVCTGYVGCNREAVIALVAAAVGAIGIATSSYVVNHLDLAAPFAGSMMGLTNTAATIPGMVSPVVVGALTQDGNTREQWLKVFYISGGFFAFGTVFYSIFGSGVNQPWSTVASGNIPRKRSPVLQDASEQEQLLDDDGMSEDS